MEKPTPRFDQATVDKITQLIRERRSIKPKDFSGELVPQSAVELMLENAHWAPNHGNTEPWYFVVFQGEGLKRLAQAQADMYKAHTPEAAFKEAKYQKLAQNPLLCSHVIAICHRRGDLPKIPVLEEVEAVATAVQNLHLTATALGYAGYWSSGGMTYQPGMQEFLGLGGEDQVLGFFMLGCYDGAWPAGKRKSSWQDKVRWED